MAAKKVDAASTIETPAESVIVCVSALHSAVAQWITARSIDSQMTQRAFLAFGPGRLPLFGTLNVFP
jgi:hypothetical protein